jgi:hypothetical protein
MANYEQLIEECIYKTPLALMAVEDLNVITKVNNYLPYSTAFEIECSRSEAFNVECFTTIPDIMSVNIDSCEQRFRIKPGIKGFITLYNICEQLKINSALNMDSGIHYHVDVSDFNGTEKSKFYNLLLNRKADFRWILKELDAWNYKGAYNSRAISSVKGNWVRCSGFNTIEFRIGEMSFDYEVLVKRIIHINDIVKRIKREFGFIHTISDETVDKKQLTSYLKNNNPQKLKLQGKLFRINQELMELAKKEDSNYNSNLEKEIISNRIIKI